LHQHDNDIVKEVAVICHVCNGVTGVNGRCCRWTGKQHPHGVLKCQGRLYRCEEWLICHAGELCIEVLVFGRIRPSCLSLIYQSESKVCIYPTRKSALNWINHSWFLPSIGSSKISMAVHPSAKQTGQNCNRQLNDIPYCNFRTNTPERPGISLEHHAVFLGLTF
jgi:hypothetical protein